MTWDVVEVAGSRTVTISDPDGGAVSLQITGPTTTLLLEGTGLQGPPGPAGPSGEAAEETHVFAAPQQTWDVVHQLPVAHPSVLALDTEGAPVQGDVTFPAPNVVRVTWAWPMAGSLVLTT